MFFFKFWFSTCYYCEKVKLLNEASNNNDIWYTCPNLSPLKLIFLPSKNDILQMTKWYNDIIYIPNEISNNHKCWNTSLYLPRMTQDASRSCHQPLLLNKASNNQGTWYAGVYISSLEGFFTFLKNFNVNTHHGSKGVKNATKRHIPCLHR